MRTDSCSQRFSLDHQGFALLVFLSDSSLDVEFSLLSSLGLIGLSVYTCVDLLLVAPLLSLLRLLCLLAALLFPLYLRGLSVYLVLCGQS